MLQYFETTGLYSEDEFIAEFTRRVEWNYPTLKVSIVYSSPRCVYAWVNAEFQFAGSIKSEYGHYQKLVSLSEVGM